MRPRMKVDLKQQLALSDTRQAPNNGSPPGGNLSGGLAKRELICALSSEWKWFYMLMAKHGTSVSQL